MNTALPTQHPTAAHAPVQRVLEQAVAGGAPGIAAEIRDHGEIWFGAAGFADTATGRERTPRDRFRIGSTTKAFTATVVLQLVGEGALNLDDSVGEHLPGLVEGNGYDGTAITVRQLLNHTSGIFNYGNDPQLFAKGMGRAWYEHRYDNYTPEELIRIGLATPPYFAPGAGFGYSNTNYYLAALIVEKITGRPFATELEQRLLRPLELTGTYLPAREVEIQRPYAVHYSTLFAAEPGAQIHDATQMNQSFGWVAGGMVSTTADLQRFFGALLGGYLLRPAEQRAMCTTVATTGGPQWIPNTRYGLGVFCQELPGGVTVWGNGGATYGSWTYAMGTRDGRHLLTCNVNGDWTGLGAFAEALTAEFGSAR